MPTKEEQEELFNNCTWIWTTKNGVNGYKITSKINGNSIFLPATGFRSGSSLMSAGNYGSYWLKSLHMSMPCHAWSLNLYLDNVRRVNSMRYNGLPIRPVCP